MSLQTVKQNSLFNVTVECKTKLTVYCHYRQQNKTHCPLFLHTVKKIPLFTVTHHHHHQSLNRKGRWGTTDDFATSLLHLSLFSTALWDLPNSRPVNSLVSSSHLFLCLPCPLDLYGKEDAPALHESPSYG